MDEKKEDESKLPVRRWRARRRMYPFGDISGEFNRIFNEFRTGLEDFFWPSPRRPSEGALALRREPPVDIIDAGEEIIVSADLPGIPKENLEINVGENSIEISGEVKEEKEEKEEGYYYRERGYHRIYRELPLPSEVIAEKAEATLNHGVLEIKIPKKEPTPKAKKHKLEIK